MVPEEVTTVTAAVSPAHQAHTLAFGAALASRAHLAMSDWFDVVRSVMMVAGGVVVIVLVLVVGVAIVSGLLGMIGRLRRRG